MRIGFRFNSANFAVYVQRVMATTSPASSGPMQDGLLAASDAYHEAMRQRFASASDGDGTWEPLAPRTIEEHHRYGDGPPPHTLHLTGALEASLQRGEENHLIETTPTSVVEGTSDPHARFQHSGTDRIPVRTILVPPDGDTISKMKTPIVEGARAALKS